jgi:4-hydroxybenzoate polyprenyltransferase
MRLLLDYARERMTPGRVLPAGALVTIAAFLGRGSFREPGAAADVAAAFALVIAFRAWDDLMDRERDRSGHPERVLVRATSTTPLVATTAAAAIGAVTLVGAVHGLASVILVAVYALVLAWSYATRRSRSATREWILLLKYGVFTAAIVGFPSALRPRALLSAAIAFAIACIYEWLHDAESPVFSLGGTR